MEGSVIPPRVQKKGFCFLTSHLLTSHNCQHPRNMFPACYPASVCYLGPHGVSVASRGHTTPPDGNTPRLGTCLLEQTKEFPEGREKSVKMTHSVLKT